MCCKLWLAGYSNDVFCLLMTLPKLKISCRNCNKKKLSCKPFSWILNKTAKWNFPLFLLLCLFGWLMEMKDLKTKSTWISIIHSMIFHVSLKVISGDKFLVTQSTDIWIFPRMTIHVSLIIVQGYESFITRSTLIWNLHSMKLHVYHHVVGECKSNVTLSTMLCTFAGITLQMVPGD